MRLAICYKNNQLITFQKGNFANKQAVYQGIAGDCRKGDGSEGEEGLGVCLGRRGAAHHGGEGCKGEEGDLGGHG